jgi:hypothetical protein
MNATTTPKHWGDALSLRDELIDQHGHLADLQMSLYNAVFQTAQVPYRSVGYYGDITQPTPKLVSFMADIAARLGTPAPGTALFHLDQGMGGGKSHALVGLHHMANTPDEFFATELGNLVRNEAQDRAGSDIDLIGSRVVVLSADHMTPGTAAAEYGPARTLFERFLWVLFDGDEEPYNRHRAEGANKASLRRALEEVGEPVLILLDELMEYALKLSSRDHLAGMPDEQAFLNALMETANQVPRVAFVLVMIRSDLDEHGYNDAAAGFRDYINARVERNGTKVAVTEPQDFRTIIRRRIFNPASVAELIAQVAEQWDGCASEAWRERVFERLGSRRGLTGFHERLVHTYPFHPDLMALVEDDWARNTGFQRVRSTVRIFAASAHHWVGEHKADRWAPPLIGVGDVPLQATIEEVLSSGLLRDNERAIQSYRSVAASDVIGKSGDGKSAELDARFAEDHPDLAVHPHPCLRMATALFLYSLVPRTQARSGATKAEMLAAAYVPDPAFTYGDAEEAHSLLTHEDDGLGALDVIHGGGGSTPTRYLLSIEQTLRMFYKQAKAQVRYPDEPDDLIWQRVQRLANRGRFDKHVPIDAPTGRTPLGEVFAAIEERNRTRLVILDPSHWTLLNGEDNQSRHDIETLLGLHDVPMTTAASCVVACVNTQRRRRARDRAAEVAAYELVLKTLDQASDLRPEAERKHLELRKKLDQEIESAFQHYCYLTRDPKGLTAVAFEQFSHEQRTALNGNHVWDALVTAGRAAQPGHLAGNYLPQLIDLSKRNYTVKEVVSHFWEDPAFPLVASEDDLRRAIYEAVTQPTWNGHPPWQIVSETGEVLTVSSPGGIAIHAINQVIRPYQPLESEPEPEDDDDERSAGEKSGDGGTEATPEYKRYTVRLPHRSVLDDEARKRVYDLLLALTDALEVGGPDVQLADVTVTLTAAAGDLAPVEHQAQQSGASWSEQEEDF